MLQFSADHFTIGVFVGQEPDILHHYKKQAVFIDDLGLQDDGTLIYIIISQAFTSSETAIIAFRTDPVGYAGFRPALHYEMESKTLFIGAGTVVKTIRLTDYKVIFEKNYGFGFWGWGKYGDFVIQQEETDFGVFNIN